MITELEPVPDIPKRVPNEMYARWCENRPAWAIMRYGSLPDRVSAFFWTGCRKVRTPLKRTPAVPVVVCPLSMGGRLEGEMLLPSGLVRQVSASLRKMTGSLLEPIDAIILANIRESIKPVCLFKAGRNEQGKSMSSRQVAGLLFLVMRAIARPGFARFPQNPSNKLKQTW